MVVTYNLPGNPALKLDADTIAGIFLGTIKKWNDPKIAATNPGTKLPDKDIVVVHRSDGSGTTYIWTDYLSKISAEWKSKVGTNTSVSWPTGIGGKGNEGVAGQIKQTPGALGYVELIYAIQNKMPYAEVKNSAGKFIKPISRVDHCSDGHSTNPRRFSLLNHERAGRKRLSDRRCDMVACLPTAKRRHQRKEAGRISEMGAQKDGEKMAKDLDYASLPEELQQRVLKRIDEIKM